MIYDEPTIDFIIEKVKKMRNEQINGVVIEDSYNDGKYMAYSMILKKLYEMKKIKAIN